MAATNRILSACSEEERRRLEAHLERVRLPGGKILCEPGDRMRYAFFPVDGVISLLGLTTTGSAAEVAVIGNDGVVGLPILVPDNTAPYQILVQVAADAWRVHADVLGSQFRRDSSLQAAVMEHLHYLLAQMVQSGVCNRYHTARQRLCRWLLMSQDRVTSNTIPLTQEFIGHMLGADRRRVSAAAATLQEAGYIRQRHGQLTILNRGGLERWSCECYEAVRGRVGDKKSALHRNPPALGRAIGI